MSTRAQTDILKNLKKRETDKRHRLNKKRTFDEAVNKLAKANTENEKLKRIVERLQTEIFRLTSEKQLHEKRFESIYNELEKEIECVRAEAEGLGEQGA